MIKWLVLFGDLIVLNFCFLFIYYYLHKDDFVLVNTNLRLICLWLNISYFFAIYFIPVKIYRPVLFIENVVQRSVTLIALHSIIFISGVYFLKLENDVFSRYFVVFFYGTLFVIFTIYRVVTREALKHY